VKLSLSTGTFYPYPLRWILTWARGAGFDGVELVVNPEAVARGGEGVRRLAEAEGMEIFSVHPTVVPLPGWRERSGGRAPTLRLAQQAGAGLVVLHTPRATSLEAGDGRALVQQVEAWQRQTAGAGPRLAIENKAVRAERDWGYALTDLERLRAFAERYDLGLVLDTTHAGTAGEDLLSTRRILGQRLANVHLSDMGGRLPLSGRGMVGTLLGEHRFPGAGDLPLGALLANLAGSGYDGPITLEVNPWAASAWWPPAARRRLATAVQWMREQSASR
jgi:sugar phosphate isomerase/epimerase